MREAFGSWTWRRAEPLGAWTPALADQAFQYLSHLHGMLASGRVEEFMKESDQALMEMTELAYGVPVGPLKRGMEDRLKKHAADVSWTLLPLDGTELDLRLVGNGRMIDCLRRNWQPALRFAKNGGRAGYSLPVKIGRVYGRWQIL